MNDVSRYDAGPPPRVVALDLDGVVWRGSEIIPGVPEALEDAVGRGLDLRYVSNNSTMHRETVSERLVAAGLPAGIERVLTSGFICGEWLRDRIPQGSLVLVVGEGGLIRELQEAGFEAAHVSKDSGQVLGAADRAAETSAVVVGIDRDFDYRTLAAAQTAIRAGALYVATNTDATFPTTGGRLDHSRGQYLRRAGAGRGGQAQSDPGRHSGSGDTGPRRRDAVRG